MSFKDQFGGYAKYFGHFKNNMFEGEGELIYSNGDKYSGQFKEGLYHG